MRVESCFYAITFILDLCNQPVKREERIAAGLEELKYKCYFYAERTQGKTRKTENIMG